MKMKFNHIGIPTKEAKENAFYHDKLKVHVSRNKSNQYSIEWLRFEDNSPFPELVKTVPHPAYEVNNITEAVNNEKVIFPPYELGNNMTIAFIEVDGAPVEFIEIRD